VIAGERDDASLQAARELASALPDARLERIAGAGHVVNLAAPERVNALLREFLARCSAPR
jgi:pimeloyl-ACP methyl ester carboxylesterase